MNNFIFKCEVLTNDNQSLSPPYFANMDDIVLYIFNSTLSINNIINHDFGSDQEWNVSYGNALLTYTNIIIDPIYAMNTSGFLTAWYYNHVFNNDESWPGTLQIMFTDGV